MTSLQDLQAYASGETERKILWMIPENMPLTKDAVNQHIESLVEHVFTTVLQEALGKVPDDYIEAAFNSHSLCLKQAHNQGLQKAREAIQSLIPKKDI